MSKLNSSFSSDSLQQCHEEIIMGINQIGALVDFAIATRLSELDDKTIFGYFEVLSNIVEKVKALINKNLSD